MSALALAAVAGAADPAAAGGSWLSPVRDRYEPGETVTLVGYVGPGGTLGSVEDGPFFAYLRRLEEPLRVPNELQMAPFVPQSGDLPIGQLLVQGTGRGGYLAYRVTIAEQRAGGALRGRLLQLHMHEGAERSHRGRRLRRTRSRFPDHSDVGTR
jgi:hypothetical protein